MNSLTLKAAWQEGKVTVGTWIFEFNTPGIARLLASTGVDFVVFDQEHSGFGIDTIRGLLAQTRPLNLAALVRPPANEYFLVAPLLDAGSLWYHHAECPDCRRSEETHGSLSVHAAGETRGGLRRGA